MAHFTHYSDSGRVYLHVLLDLQRCGREHRRRESRLPAPVAVHAGEDAVRRAGGRARAAWALLPVWAAAAAVPVGVSVARLLAVEYDARVLGADVLLLLRVLRGRDDDDAWSAF